MVFLTASVIPVPCRRLGGQSEGGGKIKGSDTFL